MRGQAEGRGKQDKSACIPAHPHTNIKVLIVEIETWSVGLAVWQVHVGLKGQALGHGKGCDGPDVVSFTSSVLSPKCLGLIKIGEFPISLSMDLSQNDDPVVTREDSFVFLEKDVSSQISFVLLLF